MDDWLPLFRRAMAIMDAAPPGLIPDDWTIGGGTMLFRRFGHRTSRDIDIFLSHPQAMVALSPRLNDVAAAATDQNGSYLEQSNFVKLSFPDGDIDFIVAPHLMHPFATRDEIAGRPVWVETPAEILAKKVLYRAADFTARDIFDLAFLIGEGSADALGLEPATYGPRLGAILTRITLAEAGLRGAFGAIDRLLFQPSWDEAVAAIHGFAARFPCARDLDHEIPS